MWPYAERPYAERSPQTCVRLSGPELAALHTDHVPVLLHCLVRMRRPCRERNYRVLHRLERLRDSDTARGYLDAVSRAAEDLLLPTPPQAAHDQAAADAAAATVVRILTDSAQSTIGTRTVRSGVCAGFARSWLKKASKSAACIGSV